MELIRLELKDILRRFCARPSHVLFSVAILSGGLFAFLLTLSQLDAFVLKPLPFPDADRLVRVGYARVDAPNSLGLLAGSRIERMRRESKQLALAAYSGVTVVVRDDDGLVRLTAQLVTADLFGLLGVAPVLGRAFNADDDRVGAPPVVVISDRMWRDRHAADAAVVGKTIVVNAQAATIIGVMPPGFAFPTGEQLWMPAQLPPSAQPGEPTFFGLGRLNPGATLAGAQAEMEAQFALAQRETPDQLQGLMMQVQPLTEHFVDSEQRAQLWLMFGAGTFVLLLACANVANLQLVRTLARRHELSLRIALGAGRIRLIVSALVESLALSTLAGAIALGLTGFTNRWLASAQAAADLPEYYWINPSVDARLLACASLCALLTALLSGALPALRASATDLTPVLRDGGRGTRGQAFARFSRYLVIGQIALSVVLLCSTAVSIETLRSLTTFDIGTRSDPDTVMTARIKLFPENYPQGADQVALFERVADRLRAEPGVAAVTVATVLPGANGENSVASVDGGAQSTPPVPIYRGAVDDEFARAYGVELVAGRWFDRRDGEASLPVAIVDQRFVDQLLDSNDTASATARAEKALGRRLQLDPTDSNGPWRTIVGISRPIHVKAAILPTRPLVLLPLRQAPNLSVVLAVHLRVPPGGFAPRIDAALRAEDPSTPAFFVRTQLQSMERHRYGERGRAELFGWFGALGLLLSAAGIYGVLAFSVAQRTTEIGTRRAVGATDRQVLNAVAGRSATQVALGLVCGFLIGVPWAVMLGQQSALGHGASKGALLAVALTIAVAATLAIWRPLRSALAIDPMVALRHE